MNNYLSSKSVLTVQEKKSFKYRINYEKDGRVQLIIRNLNS